jgi:hypothetical protein
MIAPGVSGYFDDAGKVHDLPSMVIGGFIGRKEQWEGLWSSWARLLSKHDLAYFHGVDCEHGNEEFDKLAKAVWKNPRARSDCRMEFVGAIVEAGLTGFVSGVVSADYKALDGSAQKKLGKPFSLAAQTLVVIAKDWANERHVYDLLPYFFEAGSEGYGEFLEVFNKAKAHAIRRDAYRMKSCSLVGKECIPAQAADLIAYEYSHCMNDLATWGDEGFRRPAVIELNKRLIIKAKYHNAKSLAEVLSKPNSEYRPFTVPRKWRP